MRWDEKYSENLAAVDNTILIVPSNPPRVSLLVAPRQPNRKCVSWGIYFELFDFSWYLLEIVEIEKGGKELKEIDVLKFNAWWIFETNEILIIY